MGDAAGRNANRQYSLEGRNAGMLASADAAELMKVTGLNLEQLVQRGDLSEFAGQVQDKGMFERLGIMGGLSVNGYDGADRWLPWHLPESGPNGLGITTVHNGDNADLAAMMESAKLLDWPMKVVPGLFRLGNKRIAATRPDSRNPEKAHPLCFLVRDEVHNWPVTTLGQCGAKYPIYRNEQLLEAFLRLSETGQINGDAVGHYDAGQKVFVAIRIGETRYVCGDDPHDLLLTGTLDHSGEGAIQLDIGVVRRFCLNTIKLAKVNARNVLSIAHKGSTENVAAKVDTGAVELLKAEQFFSEYERRQAELEQYEVTVDTFARQIAPELIEAESKGERASTMAETKRQALISNYESGDTLANLNFNGRRVLQAVSEHSQWLTDTRTERGRFMSVWSESGDTVKRTRKAEKLVRTLGTRKISA